MEMLTPNWISSEPIDFEHKQYTLLAYEQSLMKNIEKKSIYPSLYNVIENHRYVNEFLTKIYKLKDSTKHPTGFDLTNKKLMFESSLIDDSVEEHIKIAEFGFELIDNIFKQFRKMYDVVDNSIDIIGEKNYLHDHISGFVIMRYGLKTFYYCYGITPVYYPEPSYILELELINDQNYIKKRFTKNVFDVFLSDEYPFDETNIPIFKRKFLKYILT